jgi:hypothetical protein
MLIHADARSTSVFIGFALWKAFNDIGLRGLGGESGIRPRISVLGCASCRKQYAISASGLPALPEWMRLIVRDLLLQANSAKQSAAGKPRPTKRSVPRKLAPARRTTGHIMEVVSPLMCLRHHALNQKLASSFWRGSESADDRRLSQCAGRERSGAP